MTVAVYSTPTCPYCVKVKDYLSEKNVEFNDIDVAEDPAEAQKMVEKTGQMGVPVLIIEKDGKEEIIVGFDQSRIDEVLGL